jgi:hypothetical protein
MAEASGASGSRGGSRLAEALAALKAARSGETQPARTTAERFEAATRALRAAIRDNPMDVRIREAIAELHDAEGSGDA